MQIKINGQSQDVKAAKTLKELADEKGLASGRVIFEHNGKIVPCADWAKTGLTEDDTLEILSFVGGG